MVAGRRALLALLAAASLWADPGGPARAQEGPRRVIDAGIEGRAVVAAADGIRITQGEVTLAPSEFHEFCVEVAAGGGFDYAFRSEQPVDFDIHYHEGQAIRFPVRMTGVSEEAARFVAPEDRSYCLMWVNQSVAPTSLTYRVGP